MSNNSININIKKSESATSVTVPAANGIFIQRNKWRFCSGSVPLLWFDEMERLDEDGALLDGD